MNQDGPSMIIETPPPPPPPPPPGPHIATDINMFSHICPTYYPLFFLVVHMYPVWWGLHDTHFSTSGFNIRFPRTPQNENKNLKTISSDYFHILHIVELWCDFKKFVGPWSIYIYIYNVYEFCWPMYTDLGRPGDTFAVAGDRAI